MVIPKSIQIQTKFVKYIQTHSNTQTLNITHQTHFHSQTHSIEYKQIQSNENPHKSQKTKKKTKNKIKNHKIHFEWIYQLHFQEELKHILFCQNKQQDAKESMKYQFQKHTPKLYNNIHYIHSVIIKIHFHHKGSPKQ